MLHLRTYLTGKTAVRIFKTKQCYETGYCISTSLNDILMSSFFKSLVHNWRKLSNIVVNRTILSRIKENQLSVNMFLSNRKLTIWLNIYNGFLCLLTLLVNGLTFSITEIKKYTRKLYSFVASLLNNLSFLNMKLLNYKMLLSNWKLAILNTLVSR